MQQSQSLLPRRPLRESLASFTETVKGSLASGGRFALEAAKKIGQELFPSGNNPWNRTRRELAGLATGSALSFLLITNFSPITDGSMARTMKMIDGRCEPVVQMLIESGANTNSTPKEDLIRQCSNIYYNERYTEEYLLDPERWLRIGYVFATGAAVIAAGTSTILMSRRALDGVKSLRQIEAAK